MMVAFAVAVAVALRKLPALDYPRILHQMILNAPEVVGVLKTKTLMFALFLLIFARNLD